MPTQNQGKFTSKAYMKELKIFYRFAIQSFIFLMLAVLGMTYLADSEPPELNLAQGVFVLIMLAVFIGVYIGGRLIRRKIYKRILRVTSLQQKLQKYRIYFLTSLLSWKLIGLLGMVGFYVSENYVFLVFGVLALISLFIQKPNLEKLTKEAVLSSAQSLKMQDPKFIIS
ncbi:MAG: hypothetical protein ACOCPM_05830 [Bacteroidales bacterium]